MRSVLLATGCLLSAVSHTFDEPGIYEYYCTIHPSMTGAIVVETASHEEG